MQWKNIRKEHLINLRQKLKIKQNSFIIFYNAKIIDRKNPQLLINSFLKINKNCKTPLTLIIAGDGNIKDKLEFKSALASYFVASLELSKEGKIFIKQKDDFNDI